MARMHITGSRLSLRKKNEKILAPASHDGGPASIYHPSGSIDMLQPPHAAHPRAALGFVPASRGWTLMPAPSEGDPDCKQLPGRDRSFGIFLDMPSILPVSATTEVSSLLTRMDSITGLSARVCGLTCLQTNPEVIA